MDKRPQSPSKLRKKHLVSIKNSVNQKMRWNDLNFCFSKSCAFCEKCRKEKRQIDVYHDDEVDIFTLNPISAFAYLDMRTFFVQQCLDQLSNVNEDQLHKRILLSLCYMLSKLLDNLQEFWQFYLDIFFGSDDTFNILETMHRCHSFSARQFQRFFTQWRSFATDEKICSFGADGVVTVDWTTSNNLRKRKYISKENDIIQKNVWISRIDEWIARLNKEIQDAN